MESRWQDIFETLKEDKFDVYSPATKIGECKSPYIVIKDDGATKYNGISTEVNYYSIMCYVPKDMYSKLEIMILNVKKSMKKLSPMILPAGNQTPSYYDDKVKAHMVSIEYSNYKKMI